MHPQGVCRIRKPACAGNGCAIFPVFQTADWGQKIRYPAADDLFRVSLVKAGSVTRLFPYSSVLRMSAPRAVSLPTMFS